MGDRFEVYAGALPILVTTCPHLISKPSIERYTADYLAVLEGGARYVSIVDARPTKNFMHAANREKLARFGKETRHAREAFGTAIIVLTTSVLVRASIRTMHWQAETGQQTYFVATEDGAIERALAVLDQFGIARPDDATLARARERFLRGRQNA